MLPESFKNAIGAMMDVSLLKDPVFMMIGISNIFGMAGLYVPFVYLVDAAVLDVRLCYMKLTVRVIHFVFVAGNRTKLGIVSHFHYWYYQHRWKDRLRLHCRFPQGRCSVPEQHVPSTFNVCRSVNSVLS